MTENGIKEYYKAYIIVEKDDDPNNELFDTGFYRVYKDGNELAENSTW